LYKFLPCSEIEKFISDNTKEISKEKYLCPLSGKKFRGPEFVRKHIFNKHASKLEQVKQDVRSLFYYHYVNNVFLRWNFSITICMIQNDPCH